jgi:hypothetical protein
MFTFESVSDMEMVSHASESLGNTRNIWDNDRTLVYFI